MSNIPVNAIELDPNDVYKYIKENKVQCIIYWRSGKNNDTYVVYLKGKLLHREDGPAFVCFRGEDNTPFSEQYYLYGKKKRSVRYGDNNSIIFDRQVAE